MATCAARSLLGCARRGLKVRSGDLSGDLEDCVPKRGHHCSPASPPWSTGCIVLTEHLAGGREYGVVAALRFVERDPQRLREVGPRDGGDNQVISPAPTRTCRRSPRRGPMHHVEWEGRHLPAFVYLISWLAGAKRWPQPATGRPGRVDSLDWSRWATLAKKSGSRVANCWSQYVQSLRAIGV